MILTNGEKMDLRSLLAEEITTLPFEYRYKNFNPGKGMPTSNLWATHVSTAV